MDLELDFVSFEQAKALEELGFPQETYDYLYLDGELISKEEYYEMDCGGPFSVELFESDCLSAPSLELVSKWLREEKNLFIIPDIYDTHSDTFTVVIRKKFGGKFKESILLDEYDDVTFPSYELALSAGIDKAIEILKQAEDD